MPAEPIIERPPTPETEPKPETLEETTAPEAAPPMEAAKEEPSTTAPAAAPAAASKDESLVKIEKVLEENLKEVFFTMDPATRLKFKAAGEKLALQLRDFVEKAKANSKKILKLIHGWLRMIPRVNKYFLDQEAKIKTDKVLRMIDEKKQEKM